MSRLTEKKFLDNFKAIKNISPNYVASKEELMYEKLGKLENLEEQLGCPLEVVAKAIIQNCIYMGFLTETEIGLVWEDNEPKYVISVEQWENGNQVELKDYKKAWWLREDKSE